MSKKYDLKKVKLDELILDKENPRFAELYNGSDKESDIVEYLLYTESADEVAEAISKAKEFYEDRPLWVYRENGKYIVKDGNRRCSAVKALQLPNKYGLDISKFEIEELPVLEYHNLIDLETRIRVEHNSGLFKKWGRIAKALEIYRLFSTGNSIESLTEIDSKPKDFIKIATFYYEAVKLRGEDFKKLVREGRGATGGKTIIFERLFRKRNSCGYSFAHTGELIIKNNELFEAYIDAIVSYLIDNSGVTSRTLDGKSGLDTFLSKLKHYGFPPKEKPVNSSQSNTNDANNQPTSPTSNESKNDSENTEETSTGSSKQSNNTDSSSGGTRYSVKHNPSLKRKQIPSALKKLIDECYNLNENNFANAKTALTRVTLECTLKYVVENTNKMNGKPIKNSNHFQPAFYNNSKPRKYTDFDTLKSKFTELITDTGVKKAFENFDIQNPHQIIHNYHVTAVPANAKALCDNLIDLLEFMLQDETDLINSLNMGKL